MVSFSISGKLHSHLCEDILAHIINASPEGLDWRLSRIGFDVLLAD